MVEDPRFDFDALFDEDYLYFYRTFITPERSDEQAKLIWRLLELEPGMAVLDLACGDGRIANRLAGWGCQVTGLDRSQVLLEEARTSADSMNVSVEYRQGDMREIPWRERFDRIVNWFTSFGYFSDHDNRTVLLQAYGALKSGGRLLLEHQNRDYILRDLQRHIVLEHPDDPDSFLIDRVNYDIATGRTETDRTTIRAGRTRKMHFSIRLFTFPELRDWLLAAGFSKVDGFDQEGKTLGLDSRRIIAVGFR